MHGNGRWQRFGLLLVVAVLTIASFATLVHRHEGADDQGCALCHVRHTPGIDNPVVIAIAAPVATERYLAVAVIQLQSRYAIAVRSGRAPPTT